MKPLHIGRKAAPAGLPSNLKVESITRPALGHIILPPRGERLRLVPIADRFFISSPDAGRAEGMVGDLHLPADSMLKHSGYALVTVEACGPEVKTVKEGDKVLVVRPQCNKVVYEGHEYWWTTEPAVMGIKHRA